MSQAATGGAASTTAGPQSAMTEALAERKIGTVLIAFFQLSAIGPLLVTAGVVVAAFAATGLTAVPIAFLLTVFVLALFSLGYVAFARAVQKPGAFYTLIGTGLGRPAGVAAGLVALIGYNALQVAVYGLIGPQVAAFLADNTYGSLHIAPSWWQCALGVWFAVALLGLARVDVTAKVLGILSIAEILVILAISLKGLHYPAGGHMSLAPLNPTHLTWHSVGPLAAIAVLGFIGFELAPVYTRESRDPQRTPICATFTVLALTTVVYVAGSFAMTAAYGTSTIQTAQTQSTSMFFALAPGILASIGRCLFLTSLLAAAISYHNTVWHYGYDLANDSLFPRALVRVGPNGIPRTVSLLQSLIGLLAIVAALTFHWDPVNQLFYIGGTFGGLDVLLLLAATSLAALCHFLRTADRARSETRDENRAAQPDRDGVIIRYVAPALATLLLAGMAWACIANFATLIGVTPNDPVAWILPSTVADAVLLGAAWALTLKFTTHHTYQRLPGPAPRVPTVPDSIMQEA